MLKFGASTKGKIGLLVPRSQFLQDANQEFVQGLQLYLTLYGDELNEENCELIIEDIGNAGINSTKEKVEKLLLADKVDVLIGMISYKVALELHPLFESKEKLMLIVNPGAHMIADEAQKPYLFGHSLQCWQHSYMFGQYAASNIGSNVYMFNSLYDAGFDNHTTFAAGFQEAGGTQWGTGITHILSESDPLKEAFDAAPWQEIDWVYAHYTGLKLFQFLEEYANYGAKVPVCLSPMAIAQKIPSRYHHLEGGYISAHCGYHGNETSAYADFVSQCQKYLSQEPSPFTLLGYESGEIAYKLFKLAFLNKGAYNEQINLLKQLRIKSPRGEVVMNPDMQVTQAPLSISQLSLKNGTVSASNLYTQSGISEENQHLEFIRNQPKSSWLHPYGF